MKLQFLKFVGVGGVSTLNHYVVMVLAVELLGASPIISSLLGFVVGAVTSYLLNYFYTFRASVSHKSAASKFLAVAVVGACLNTAIVGFLIELMGLHYFISQMIATGTVLVLNFLASKYWSFASA